MIFNCPPLILEATSIEDALGRITLEDLPDPTPANPVRLQDTSPLMERLWRIALANVESNIVVSEGQRYLGAGKHFGVTVYTRDISYSGVLGLNHLYPDLMRDSLEFTRRLRSRAGFKVSTGYAVSEISAPWEELSDEEAFMTQFHTNSYTRRTDDVVWLWAACDLMNRLGESADWQWLYDWGNIFFQDFYEPFYDAEDGLYRGQASFIDIHFHHAKATGYPQHWSIADCVLCKALSTNCLYVLGLSAMATATRYLGKKTESAKWEARCEALKMAIRRELRHPDGSFAYLKDKEGDLEERREALGTALVVISGIATGEEAKQALAGYPVSDAGVPLFLPYFEGEKCYHNHSAWPFVDAFFILAQEAADGVERHARQAALLARTCVDDGTFHEVVDYRNKRVQGSGSQLWTAAAFIGLCYRAGLVNTDT